MKNLKKLLLAGIVVVGLCGSNSIYGMVKPESKDVRAGGTGKPATELDEGDEGDEGDEDEKVDDSKYVLATRTITRRPMHNEIDYVMVTVRTPKTGFVDTKDLLSGETYQNLIQKVRRELDANLKTRSSDDDGVSDLEDDRKRVADSARDNWISACIKYAYFQMDAFLLGNYSQIDLVIYKNNGDAPLPYSYDTMTSEERARIQTMVHDMAEARKREMGPDWRKFTERQKKDTFKKILAQREGLLKAHAELERRLAPQKAAERRAAQVAKEAEKREVEQAAQRARDDERRRADEYRTLKTNSDTYLAEKAERERVAKAIAIEREKIRLRTQRCNRFQQAGSVALSALFAGLAISNYEPQAESWFGGTSNFDL